MITQATTETSTSAQRGTKSAVKQKTTKPAEDPLFKPIYINGQLIQTYRDLIPHIKLLPFEDAMKQMYVRDELGRSPDFVPANGDEVFRALIKEQKPKGEYYHQTFGDKLLYLKRVDRINYDVAEVEKIKIQERLLEEFDKFKKK